MSLRRKECRVDSFEQLNLAIMERGGSIRGVLYDEWFDGCDESGELIEGVDVLTGFYSRADEFEAGCQPEIIFVPDNAAAYGSKLITREVVTGTGIAVITRRLPHSSGH